MTVPVDTLAATVRREFSDGPNTQVSRSAEARCARLQQALRDTGVREEVIEALAGPGSEQGSLTESGRAGLPDTPADSQENKT